MIGGRRRLVRAEALVVEQAILLAAERDTVERLRGAVRELEERLDLSRAIAAEAAERRDAAFERCGQLERRVQELVKRQAA